MGMNKEIDWSDVGPLFRDGLRIMFGGFMGVGTPDGIVAVLREQGTKALTLIGNDTAAPETGVGPLISAGQASRVVVSHIGTNPVTGRKMIAGELDVELVPQGTLAERVRCGGAGLGGVLTPTGVGTVVEEGKTKMVVDGKSFLVELPLRADVAILKAKRADRAGNLVYERAARNFNPLMAMAADTVLVQAENVVPVGVVSPDHVVTPAPVVDYLVVGS